MHFDMSTLCLTRLGDYVTNRTNPIERLLRRTLQLSVILLDKKPIVHRICQISTLTKFNLPPLGVRMLQH